MKKFDDEVLGTVTVKFNPLSRSIRMRLSPRGDVTVTVPKHTPMMVIRRAIRQARGELSQMRDASRPEPYRNGDAIGHSHTLAIVESSLAVKSTATLKARTIVVTVPTNSDTLGDDVQSLIRDKVVMVLRREAKAYLPKRLETLAQRHGYNYETIRFPHAISRWGSCSSSGTISLNISLMKLPLDLIDYVILHELAHTRQMNHSKAFWQEVAKHNPDYTLHRRQIQTYSPII